MGEEGMADLDIAVMIILLLLIFFERFAELLVGLHVLSLELLKPLLGLLHSYLLYAHNKWKLNI